MIKTIHNKWYNWWHNLGMLINDNFDLLLNYKNNSDYHGPLEIILSFLTYKELTQDLIFVCKNFYLAFLRCFIYKSKGEIYKIFDVALKKEHLEIVELLLKDKRVDPSDNNNYLIRWASINGHLEIVELLLKDGHQ
jgi:ankyrin repeat protein